PQDGALMIIAHQAGGVLAVRDLDQVGSADVRVFIDAAGFERPRIVNPPVDLEAFVRVAERQVVDVRLELVDLRHGQRGNRAIDLPVDVGVQHHPVEMARAAVFAQLIDQGRERFADRRAVPDGAEYADAVDVDIRTLALLIIPGYEIDGPVVIDRFEQLDVSPLRKASQPTEFIF